MVMSTLSLPAFAQGQTKHIVIKQSIDGCDTISPFSIWSNEFDVMDIESMHEKLDSIFEKLDEDLNKRIKVIAFDFDSLPNGFSHLNDIDFDFNTDSIFKHFMISSNDQRFDDLLKSNKLFFGDNGEFDFDSIANSLSDSMDVEITTDSIMENGRSIIKKKIVINGKEIDENSPVIIKEFNNDGGNQKEVVIAYKDKKEVSRPEKHIVVSKGSEKPLDGTTNHDVIEEISLADAELLVKAGISPKVITSPALRPESVKVDVTVEEKFQNIIKKVTFAFNFKDEKGIEVTLLDKDGNTLSKEKVKNTSGAYSKTIDVNEGLSPYYFLLVKDNKLFGRIIH